MGNTLLTPSIIAREALMVLRNNAVMAKLVHRDYSNEFVTGVGDTITVRKPATFVAKEFTSAIEIQEATETGVPIKMDHHLDVSFSVTSKEMSLDIKDFSKQFLVPAMQAFNDKIDTLLLSLYKDVTAVAGDPAALPTAIDPIVDAGALLNTAKAPLGDRRLVLDPLTEAAFMKLGTFHEADKVGDNGIGTGYFPKADDPDLKKWSWECRLQDFPEHYHSKGFTRAGEIISKLDELQRSKEPVRLIVRGEKKSLSQQVLLKGYTAKEQYGGVYQVAVNVLEYKAAAIRDTAIPEIPRPGKIPTQPEVVIKKDETVYDKTDEPNNSLKPSSDPGNGVIHDPINGTLLDTETGKEIDLLDPPVDKPIIDTEKKDYYINNITGELVEAPTINWGNLWDKIAPDWKNSPAAQCWNDIKRAYDQYISAWMVVESVIYIFTSSQHTMSLNLRWIPGVWESSSQTSRENRHRKSCSNG